jgi:hypothetical protein
VSILAEILAVRAQVDPLPLRTTSGPIHRVGDRSVSFEVGASGA